MVVAFIPQGKMSDGVMVINADLDFVNINKRDYVWVKVDFEKVYDCIFWEYIRYLMRRMGFGPKWMKWMEATGS